MSKYIGFTIIEVLISLAILLSLISIGIPNLNDFIVNSRVNNEIVTLQRLLLVARNAALTSNSKVTLCPLNDQGHCTKQWQEEISVFIDSNNNKILETTLNEKVIANKSAIKSGDKLQYGKTRIGLTYSATGHLSGWGQNATFSYCPENHSDKSKGIIVAPSGRTYVSSNNKTNTANIRRSGQKIICS